MGVRSRHLGLFLSSSLLAGLCYLTYRWSQGVRSFAIVTVGFGCIVGDGLVELVYIFGISTNETLNSTELYLMQGIGGILLALGLGLLYYAITQHGSGAPSEEQYLLTNEDVAWSEREQPND